MHNWTGVLGDEDVSAAVSAGMEMRTGNLCTGQVDQVYLNEESGLGNSGEVRKLRFGVLGAFSLWL